MGRRGGVPEEGERPTQPLLRESLTIREKAQPDLWATFNTKSVLGGALLGQKKYAEAEPQLQAAYEGMKQREATIPPQGKARITEALERLVQLYESTDKKDEAAKWRKELDSIKPAGTKWTCGKWGLARGRTRTVPVPFSRESGTGSQSEATVPVPLSRNPI